MWLIPIIRRSTELKIPRQEFIRLLEKNTSKGFSISRLSGANSRYFEYETIIFKNHFWTRSIFTDMITNGFMGTVISAKIEEKENGINLRYWITPNIFTSLLTLVCILSLVYYAIALFEKPTVLYYWFLMIAPYSLFIYLFNQDAPDDLEFIDALIKESY